MAADLDQEQARALEEYLDVCIGPQGREHVVWSETLGGRAVVFLEHGGQTYLLLPLAFSRPAGL
jgi:hypothetical protein